MKMNKKISTVAKMWQEELSSSGYENKVRNLLEYLNVIRLTRTWRKILNVVKLRKNASVFEFGCGGGKHLIPLAIRGYSCSGIDCSYGVLERSKSFISDVENFSRKKLDIKLYLGDFANYEIDEKYDLVFNFGVIEHFLDKTERINLIKKMMDISKPAGYVLSVVPNGIHPLREKMKTEKLGGYNIPEIDYSPELMIEEMESVGARNTKIFPNNLFGYLLIEQDVPLLRKIFNKSIYYASQLMPSFLTCKAYKYSYSLICISQK